MIPKSALPGATISVVAPASAVRPEEIAPTLDSLRAEGYTIRDGAYLYDRLGFLAGRDEDRASDLMAAFLDPETDAVLCARGGYGCARLLPLLDLDAMATSGKALLGFSDITILHAALNRRGLASYHAPMPNTDFSKRPYWVWKSLTAALRGEDPIHPDAPAGATIVGGVAEGELVGGCLCLIADLIATAEELDFTGKIVLIEDVDEAPHRVDAMLTHLLNAGRLHSAAGIAMGEMTGTDVEGKHDATIGPHPWREIVTERLSPLGIPFVTDLPFGHGALRMTLPLGRRVRLDADAGKLTLIS